MKSSRKLFLAAIAQIIWSTLDDTCQYVPLTEPHMPTLMGSDQVPHFVANGVADAGTCSRCGSVVRTFAGTS